MSHSLSELCVYDAKLAKSNFVGITCEGGNLKVYFPLGYKESDDDKECRKSILNLISVLNTFSDSKSPSDIPNQKKERETGFPIQAYLRVILDFQSRGYYIEPENELHKSVHGKINWNKTIKIIQPEFAGDNLIYLNFITRKMRNNEVALITLIHKFFVYEAFSKIGFLFGSYLPEKPHITYNSQQFRVMINKEISKTYNGKNLILFNDMKTIMEYLDTSEGSKGNFSYGTEEFEYVWEKLVDHVYGVPNKADYYPHTEWHISGKVYDDKDVNYKKNALRPDTIMVIKDNDKEEVFVLDSKYYKYGALRIPNYLPNTGSIIKQIAYGKYVENNIEHPDLRVEGDSIYNAFVLPFNAKSHNMVEVFGYAKTTYETNDKSYHKIYGVLLDVKDLMLHHSYHDNEKIALLANSIKDYSEHNPS